MTSARRTEKTLRGQPTRWPRPGAFFAAAPPSAANGSSAPFRGVVPRRQLLHTAPEHDRQQRGRQQREDPGPLRSNGHPAGEPAGDEPQGAPAVLHEAQGEQDAKHRPGADEHVERRDARLGDPTGRRQRRRGRRAPMRGTVPTGGRTGTRTPAAELPRPATGRASRGTGRRTGRCRRRSPACPSRCGHDTSSPASHRYWPCGSMRPSTIALRVLGVVDLVEHLVAGELNCRGAGRWKRAG